MGLRWFCKSMRITFFLPTLLVLICAATFFWFATEPVTLVQPTPLLRAAEDLVGAEDQSQYSKKLEIFRKRLFAEKDTNFPHTSETLVTYVVSRDRAARRIPDPGFQTAILRDVIEGSKKRIEDHSFRLFLLGGALLLVSGSLLFVQARKVVELAEAVSLEFPRENLTSFSGNLNFLMKALKNKAYLIEDLQGNIASLNSQLRQFQATASFQKQRSPGWNEPTLLMDESPQVSPQTPPDPKSNSFPSLSISQELPAAPPLRKTPADPLDLEPLDLFEARPNANQEFDFGATDNLRQPAVPAAASSPPPVPENLLDKPFGTGSPSQTSELLYTQFLLGLSEHTNFPAGSQVFKIGVSKNALEDLGRTYQDTQFGVRLFGFCVDRILTYFRLEDRTFLHFEETTFTLTFCVPAYLHGAVNEEEIESAFRSKAIYLSGIPVSLPDFQIQEYRA